MVAERVEAGRQGLRRQRGGESAGRREGSAREGQRPGREVGEAAGDERHGPRGGRALLPGVTQRLPTLLEERRVRRS